MIVGIGIDSVDIARFAHWHTIAPQQLRKLFSEQEITYCLSNPIKSAERFAARFATREAFFKALATACPKKIPFFTVCKALAVEKKIDGQPIVHIDWPHLDLSLSLKCHISITHTATSATAFVVLES